MTAFPGNTEWVAELIPDVKGRIDQFVVDTDEVDDELIEVFIGEIDRLAGELQAGVDQNDSEIVRLAAHSIKGMGGTMGLPEISVLGLEVEDMAKAARIPDAKPLVDALVKWTATINAGI